MNLFRLMMREIGFRKLNFLLGVLSVVVAVGCLVAVLTLLRAHDVRTNEIIKAKEKETAAAMKKLEDEYRRITKNMGFNIRILPAGLDMTDVHDKGFADKYMPEEYVNRLAGSKLMTIDHLLPVLEQRVKWAEKERTVYLFGTRGQVPIKDAKKKKPIMSAIRSGTVIVGYELHKSLGLKVGEPITFNGKKFTVGKLVPERGTKDDIRIWMDLAAVQEMMGKTDKINGILALSCRCAGDRLSVIRKEVSALLPGTHVTEFATQAIAREEARAAATRATKAALVREKAGREKIRREQEDHAAILLPLVLLGAGVWIGFLTFMNVRDRINEIGVLRALGVRSMQILGVFLGKVFVVGGIGAVIGYLAGLVVGVQWSDLGDMMGAMDQLFDPVLLVGVLLATPLLAVLAGWLPAMLAASQDPAVILSKE